MPSVSPKGPIDLGSALLDAWDTNERINQYLLAALDPAAWQMPAPGGTGRTIASILSHVYNVRHMWLVASGVDRPLPGKLDRRTVTQAELTEGLATTAALMREVLQAAIEHGGRMKDFRPDVVGFLAYAVSHEAHHRGQVCLQAKQIGHAPSKEAGYGMWEWTKRWKEAVKR